MCKCTKNHVKPPAREQRWKNPLLNSELKRKIHVSTILSDILTWRCTVESWIYPESINFLISMDYGLECRHAKKYYPNSPVW